VNRIIRIEKLEDLKIERLVHSKFLIGALGTLPFMPVHLGGTLGRAHGKKEPHTIPSRAG
jgi:hypothetical protein